MAESGEWFSPRTRPEMLTSDDPPIAAEKPVPVRILRGPGGPVGRATAPLRRLLQFVPAIGRRIVRVEDKPSRWQLVGMWTTGSAIVAGTGLAVAAALGGAPPALTQPFEQLSVLPGIGEQAQPDSVTSADDAHATPADRQRTSGGSRSDGSASSSGYAGGSSPASSATLVYPEDLVPGRPIVPQLSGGSSSGGSTVSGSTGSTGGSTTGGSTASGSTAGGSTGSGSTGGGTGSTAPPPSDPTPTATQTPPPASDPTPDPTDPGTTDPAPPTDSPTDPASTDQPTTPSDTPTATPGDTSPADATPTSASTSATDATPASAGTIAADPTGQDEPVQAGAPIPAATTP